MEKMDRKMSKNYEEVKNVSLEKLVEGSRLRVRIQGNEWGMAEILKVDVKKRRTFYVHFLESKNCPDEWVGDNRLDRSKVYFPKRVQPSRTSSLKNSTAAVRTEMNKTIPPIQAEKIQDGSGSAGLRVSRSQTRKLTASTPSEFVSGHLTSYKYKCEVCGKGWDKLQDFNSHKKRSHLVKTFYCGTCQKKFTTDTLRKFHEKGHKKAYKCWKCGRRFGFRSNYNKHTRGKTCHGNKAGLQSGVEESGNIEETFGEPEIMQSQNILLPQNFQEIDQNLYRVKPRKDDFRVDNCDCANEKVMCYDNSCRNRLTEIECSSSCGEGCQNRRITEKKGLNTELFMTKYKGRGIKASEPIKKGDFIMEYTGEVIRDQTYRNRMKKVYAKDQHYYTCHLKSKLVLDAHRFGNNCRYVNHSHLPNCELRRWHVNGLPRMALLAKQNIDVGQELTYDYKFCWFDPSMAQPCNCGAPKCPGFF